jgi:hypothetical protein
MFSALRVVPVLALAMAAACGGKVSDQRADSMFSSEPLRDPASGKCAESAAAGSDWAPCDSGCEDLEKEACESSSNCRAAYLQLETCSEEVCEPIFYECWGVAPSGPMIGATCAELNADECSQYSDCVAIHSARVSNDDVYRQAMGDFERCAPPGDGPQPLYCSVDLPCVAGMVCNAEQVCIRPPGCDGDDCQVCFGVCVPA